MSVCADNVLHVRLIYPVHVVVVVQRRRDPCYRLGSERTKTFEHNL